MHDVSQFAKTFKEFVNVFYKAFLKTSTESDKPSCCGSIWNGRFKSTLVEGGVMPDRTVSADRMTSRGGFGIISAP